MRRQLCIILFLFFIAPVFSYAQFSGFGVGSEASLIALPEFPEPHERVEITLDTYSINTNGATIRWFEDGIERTGDKNLRKITSVVRNIGEKTTISASITLLSGQSFTVSRTFNPVRLDIVIESDTYTPALYKGAPLPTIGSAVRIVALPHTAGGSIPQNFTYIWRLNNNVLYGGSIKGKNIAEFTMPIGLKNILSVEVYDAQSIIISKRSIFLPVAEPEIYFYVDNPLRGRNSYSITDDFTLLSDEVAVRAEAYFMDKNLINSGLLIEWDVNGSSVENNTDDPYLITLQNNGGSGVFPVSFYIRNLNELLQGARGGFSVRF